MLYNHAIATSLSLDLYTLQLAGRPVFASDIYSLGITAIYLLTAKHPQDFNTDPATGKIVWRQDAPHVSPALAEILDRATHPNWCDRYFSAKEMLDAIKRKTSVNSNKLFFTGKKRSISENSTRIVPAAIAPDRNHRNLYFENSHSSSLNDWQKATIIGSIVGTFMMATLIINNFIVRNSPPLASQGDRKIINNAIDENEAIKFLENLYVLLSNKSFEKAKLAYSSRLAAQFNSNFFTQFKKITVNNLQKTSQTNSAINFIGENTYYYLDGSTQREQRSYTVSNINGELKVTNSNFLKVIKSR
jgi:serine/threonine protein kinase